MKFVANKKNYKYRVSCLLNKKQLIKFAHVINTPIRIEKNVKIIEIRIFMMMKQFKTNRLVK